MSPEVDVQHQNIVLLVNSYIPKFGCLQLAKLYTASYHVVITFAPSLNKGMTKKKPTK